jgi:hypothetical protein
MYISLKELSETPHTQGILGVSERDVVSGGGGVSYILGYSVEGWLLIRVLGPILYASFLKETFSSEFTALSLIIRYERLVHS